MSVNLYLLLSIIQTEDTFSSEDIELNQLKFLFFDINNDLNDVYNSSIILNRNNDSVEYGALYSLPIKNENITEYKTFREHIFPLQGINGSLTLTNKTFIFDNGGWFEKREHSNEALLVSPNNHWQEIKIIMNCPTENVTNITWNVTSCSPAPDPAKTLIIFNYSDSGNTYSKHLWCQPISADNIKLMYSSTNITFYLKKDYNSSIKMTKMARTGNQITCNINLIHTLKYEKMFYGYYGVLLNISRKDEPFMVYIPNNKV